MANQLAFKKLLVADGTQFDQVAAVFDNLKNYFLNAGFTDISHAIDHQDIMRAGATLADTSDDTPHWRIDNTTTGEIKIYAIKGDWDNGKEATVITALSETDFASASPNMLVRFYCNSATGMWWLYVTNTVTGEHKRAIVGTTLRRYQADTTQGIMCRYGLLRAHGEYESSIQFPYAVTSDGTFLDGVPLNMWSPLMSASNAGPVRHPSSPMPPMAAPLFVLNTGYAGHYTACCMPGEIEHVQLLTTNAGGDYTMEQIISPGIMALPDITNAPGIMHLALPYTTFTVL